MAPRVSSQLFFKVKPSSSQGGHLDTSCAVAVCCRLGLRWPGILVTVVMTKLGYKTREQFSGSVCSTSARSPRRRGRGDCPSTNPRFRTCSCADKEIFRYFYLPSFFPPMNWGKQELLCTPQSCQSSKTFCRSRVRRVHICPLDFS